MYRTHDYPIDLAVRSQARARRQSLGLFPRLRDLAARLRLN